jgi:hypothetical protein
MQALERTLWKQAWLLKFGLFYLFLAASAASAATKPASPKPTNEECLACHGDATMTKDVNGTPVSLYVNPESFKASVHGGMFSCVSIATRISKLRRIKPRRPKSLVRPATPTSKPPMTGAITLALSKRATVRQPLAFPATAALMNCCRPAIRNPA